MRKVNAEYYRGGKVIGLNPNIRVYRYTKGQYFDCHCKWHPDWPRNPG